MQTLDSKERTTIVLGRLSDIPVYKEGAAALIEAILCSKQFASL